MHEEVGEVGNRNGSRQRDEVRAGSSVGDAGTVAVVTRRVSAFGILSLDFKFYCVAEVSCSLFTPK